MIPTAIEQRPGLLHPQPCALAVIQPEIFQSVYDLEGPAVKGEAAWRRCGLTDISDALKKYQIMQEYNIQRPAYSLLYS